MSLSRAFMMLMIGFGVPSFLVAHSPPAYAQEDGGDGGSDDGGENAGDVSDTADAADTADVSDTADAEYLVDENGNYILDANGKRIKKPNTVDLTTLDVGGTNGVLNSHSVLRRPTR
ncbi:hypothetical protein [Devosia sp.]|uniref:hypothetical protein n=1 Tax=Devosia sp. TaxID=1871048 RepID=UPI00292E411B|nr:hypothetical protein [Devosia sp.]